MSLSEASLNCVAPSLLDDRPSGKEGGGARTTARSEEAVVVTAVVDSMAAIGVGAVSEIAYSPWLLSQPDHFLVVAAGEPAIFLSASSLVLKWLTPLSSNACHFRKIYASIGDGTDCFRVGSSRSVLTITIPIDSLMIAA